MEKFNFKQLGGTMDSSRSAVSALRPNNSRQHLPTESDGNFPNYLEPVRSAQALTMQQQQHNNNQKDFQSREEMLRNMENLRDQSLSPTKPDANQHTFKSPTYIDTIDSAYQEDRREAASHGGQKVQRDGGARGAWPDHHQSSSYAGHLGTVPDGDPKLDGARIDRSCSQYDDKKFDNHLHMKNERDARYLNHFKQFSPPRTAIKELSPRGEAPIDNREIEEDDDIRVISDKIIAKKAFVWAFGQNKDGELGVGSQKDALLPRPIAQALRDGQSARYISSGSHHSAVVSKSGDLFVCGSHLHGKLGLPSNGIIHLTKFNQLSLPSRAKQVACGDYHTLALTEEGKVYAWGGTLHKKTGDTTESSKAVGPPKNEPKLVQSLAERAVIIHIDCGDFHSVALDQYGALYSWGGGGQSYNKGQCGHGHANDVEQPQIVQALRHKAVKKVSAGGFHTLALCEDNELYAWGSGTYGELGSGDQSSANKPRLVKMPFEVVQVPADEDPSKIELKYGSSKPVISQISAGGHHSLVLTGRGTLYSFGYGAHGQLGLRLTTNQLLPQLVKDLISKPLTYIAAGWNHSLVLSSRGDIFASGYGNHGQLGLNDNDSRTAFQHVVNIGAKNVYRIFAGGHHSWVVIDDIVPIRSRYRAPSPVPDNKTMVPVNAQPGGKIVQVTNTRASVKVNAFEKNQAEKPYIDTIDEADEEKQVKFYGALNTMDNATIAAQIGKGTKIFDVRLSVQASCSSSATDTQMCHRFVNFESSENKVDKAELTSQISSYLRYLQNQEGGPSMVYSKVQSEYKVTEDETAWTICIVFDPKKCEQIESHLKQPLFTTTQAAGGKMKQMLERDGQIKMTLNEHELQQDPLQVLLSMWAFTFTQKLGKVCTKQPRFIELRPSFLIK